MLIDTDIIIWNMRGYLKAAEWISSQKKICISSVTLMELVQGMRNKKELEALDKTTGLWSTKVIPLNESICKITLKLLRNYSLSHGLRMADAMIAATAIRHKLKLATANTKHYKGIAELEVVPFRIDHQEAGDIS